MNFFDEVRIFVQSGDGGDGCVSFRREKYVEFGGPNGGDGGNGGSIYIMGEANLSNLNAFAYKSQIRAKNGKPGRGKEQAGLFGEDIILRAPLGTQIFHEDGSMLAECEEPGKPIMLAQGGLGGVGNARFKSSTNQAPRQFIPGTLGEAHYLVLVLKIAADVGIIGLPNAGKSTFLSFCSNARPKIADYPFTTLHPNLGMVRYHDDSFLMMDIPGLIEGAHENVGLGFKFLKHMERCLVVLHLVDAAQDDVVATYKTVRSEMESYSANLLEKKEIIVLSRTDMVEPDILLQKKKDIEDYTGQSIYLQSITQDNSTQIIALIHAAIKELNPGRSERGAYDPLAGRK